MKSLSISLTLGKASAAHGANIQHNNREILPDNIDQNRVRDNIIYVQQDIYSAYDELFGEALEEYNAKQKKPCRRIDNYYEHIEKSDREESFYEIVVQFGCNKTAPIGSENGELAKKMLDEYMKTFKQRNPNLHIINSTLHMDEASPHIHIDFVPFTTKKSKYGLSKRVSFKSALDEQGFTAKSQKQNRLVAWEDSERKYMIKILERYGFEREIKNAKHAHLEVDEYKREQELRKIEKLLLARENNSAVTIEDYRMLQSEVAALEVENQKLTDEKLSVWKSFFYSAPDKQAFVQLELDRLKIPYRETENGFESQDCYVAEIQKIEKSFKPKENTHREELRNHLDKIVMQSKNFDEVLLRLKKLGYTVKDGKYLAVKPKYGDRFIRLKSLGGEYSEQALKNRLVDKSRFEKTIDDKIKTDSAKQPDALQVTILRTVKQYTIVFQNGHLPVKKRNKKKSFSWHNCENLDRLLELNKKLNAGTTLESLRNDFARLEKSVAEKESELVELKSQLTLFTNLYNAGKRCFQLGEMNKSDYEFLAEHKITSEIYQRITTLIRENKTEIAEIEQSLPNERAELKAVADIFGLAERVAGGTYVQGLIDEHMPACSI